MPEGFVVHADHLPPPSTQSPEKLHRPRFIEELACWFIPWNKFYNGFSLCDSGTSKPPCMDSAATVAWTLLQQHLIGSLPSTVLVQFQNVWIFFPTLSPSFLSSRCYLFINECKNRSFKICRAYSVTPWYFQQVNPTPWLHEEGGHILAPFFRWGNRCLGRLKDYSKVLQLARDRFSLVFFWRSYVYNKGRIFRISRVLFWDCVQPMEISLEILILWLNLPCISCGPAITQNSLNDFFLFLQIKS